MSANTSLMSPYKGLTYYTEADGGIFFGRTQERGIISANLLSKRLTLLYGPSGAGKSSVLRAGVVNHIRELARHNLEKHGTPEFAIVVFNEWRDDPIPRITAVVRDAVGSALGKPYQADPSAEHDSQKLLHLLERSANDLGGSLLIILDQFEEYLFYHGMNVDEGSFASVLSNALRDQELSVNFLISIREDAYAKLDCFEGYIPELFENYLRLDQLDRSAARAAIEKPIERMNSVSATDSAKITIEPQLTDAVLDQVRAGRIGFSEKGLGSIDRDDEDSRIEAPFLQLVMTRLWQEETNSGSRALRLSTLERLGGAERIVQTHLDDVMRDVPPTEQDVAAGVFRFLVTPSGTKIAHTVSDLAKYGEVSEAQLTSVLKKLSTSEACILRPVPPPPDQPGEMRYEIFHDVLAPAVLDYAEQAHARKVEAERTRKKIRWMVMGGLGVLALIAISGAWYANSQRVVAVEAAKSEQAARAREQLSIKRERDTNNTIIPDIYDLLYDVSNFDQTLARFEDTLNFKRRQGDQVGVGITLANIGKLYSMAGKYSDAETKYRESLVILEKELPDHSYLGATLNGLADVYSTQGRYDEAKGLYEKARSILQRNLGVASKDVVTSLTGLAAIEQRDSRYREAEELLKQALEANRKIFGDGHQQVALSESALGTLYMAAGRNEDGVRLYEQALATLKNTVGRSNPKDPTIAQVLMNLALLETRMGKYSAAQGRLKSIEETNPDLSPVELAGYAGTNAYLLSELKRYDQALPLYKRALDIYRSEFGPEHSVVAQAMNNTAAAYRRLHQCRNAETLLGQARAIQEKTLDRSAPDIGITLSNEADCKSDEKHYAEAEVLYNQALKILSEKLGSESQDLAMTLDGLAIALREQGKLSESEVIFKRDLAIREKSLGPNHPRIADTLEEYANLLRKMNREADAASVEQRAGAIRSTNAKENPAQI